MEQKDLKKFAKLAQDKEYLRQKELESKELDDTSELDSQENYIEVNGNKIYITPTKAKLILWLVGFLFALPFIYMFSTLFANAIK